MLSPFVSNSDDGANGRICVPVVVCRAVGCPKPNTKGLPLPLTAGGGQGIGGGLCGHVTSCSKTLDNFSLPAPKEGCGGCVGQIHVFPVSVFVLHVTINGT